MLWHSWAWKTTDLGRIYQRANNHLNSGHCSGSQRNNHYWSEGSGNWISTWQDRSCARFVIFGSFGRICTAASLKVWQILLIVLHWLKHQEVSPKWCHPWPHAAASSLALTVDFVSANGCMSWIIDPRKPKTSSVEKCLVFSWTSNLTWPTPSSLGSAQGGRWEQDYIFSCSYRLLWLQCVRTRKSWSLSAARRYLTWHKAWECEANLLEFLNTFTPTGWIDLSSGNFVL